MGLKGQMSNIWGIVRGLGVSLLLTESTISCPLWAHSSSQDNPSSWLGTDRGLSWDVGLGVLKLAYTGSPPSSETFPMPLGRKQPQLHGGGLHSVWASLGWSPGPCRIVSQFSHLSSPSPLSGTLELGARKQVTLQASFIDEPVHETPFGFLPQPFSGETQGAPPMVPTPTSPGNFLGILGPVCPNSLWSTQLMRSK